EGVGIHDHDTRSCSLREQHGADTDWAGTHDKHVFTRTDTCAAYTMCTNGQRFYKRKLVSIQTIPFHQRRNRHRYPHTHSAIYMDAIYLHIHAAIGFALPAGYTMTAMKIWFYRYEFANLKIVPRGDSQHFGSNFVTEHTRIVEIRLHPFESVKVCAADADLADL